MKQIILAWMVLVNFSTGIIADVSVNLKKFEMCQEDQKTPLRIQNVALTVVGKNKIEINGVVIIEAMEATVISAIVDLSRCSDQDSLSSCEHFLQKTIDNVCPHLSAKNKLWTELVSNMQNFEPTCPLKQGEYSIVNAPFDIGPFTGIPGLQGYWIAKVTVFSDGKEIGCQTLEAMIKPKRILG